jgi:hypothetical protein
MANLVQSINAESDPQKVQRMKDSLRLLYTQYGAMTGKQ